MATRLAARRPLLRQLHALRTTPRPQAQLRTYASRYEKKLQDLPSSKAEADAILGIKREPRRGPPTVDDVSVHRAEAVRRAYYARRRNMLVFLCVLAMAAPVLAIKIWPMPEDVRKKVEEEAESRSLFNSWFGSGKKGGDKDGGNGGSIQCDAPRGSNDLFQGKKVVHAAGDKIIAAPEGAEHPVPSDADTIELVSTGTSYVPYFPKTITLPASSTSVPADPALPAPTAASKAEEYTLLGLGIRRVSFLKVQVYVVGLYVKTSSLHKLQNSLINTVNPSASALIPGEKDALRTALLDPERSTEIWSAILDSGIEMAIRISPTRGTDFNHLRDGLMRGIQGRTSEAEKKAAELRRKMATETKTIALPKPVKDEEYTDDAFGLAMKDFKAIFGGRGAAPKSSVLLMTRDGSGKMDILYQPVLKEKEASKKKEPEPQVLGSVNDPRVSKLLWLLYLGGATVSSPDARQNVVDGCVALVERPVGTVETMVV